MVSSCFLDASTRDMVSLCLVQSNFHGSLCQICTWGGSCRTVNQNFGRVFLKTLTFRCVIFGPPVPRTVFVDPSETSEKVRKRQVVP